MNKVLKVGIVGLGGMGTVHFNNYNEIENVKVVATVGVCENDHQKAKSWGLPIYDTITEMVKTHDVDIVDICTPTFTHYPLTMESLKLGKHTILEKPIALKLEDAEEMYAQAEESGVQLYVAQVLQFSREVEELRRFVETEKYGKALDAVFIRLTEAPKWSQGGWLFDKEKSGLVPYDLHIHDLDVVVSLFGTPEYLTQISGGRKTVSYQEYYRMCYGYKTGLNVCAEAGWLNAGIPFTATWRVYFENGMLMWDGKSLMAYDNLGNQEEIDVSDHILIPTGINIPPTGWFYRELRHFITCIEQNVPSALVPKEQVLSVLKLINCIS